MSSNQCDTHRTSVVEARAAVHGFLHEALTDVHRVDVVEVRPVETGDPGWEAEAVVWRPNATIQTLALPTQRPVLDQEEYVVRLDRDLNVVSYGVKKEER